MNKIIKSLALMSAAVFSVISCETYKVDDPEMTAISKIDGKYVTFAYENGSTQPSTVFAVLITNTTFNDSDKAWVTITDLNPAARYHCYRAENRMESISRRCRIRPGRLLYSSNQTGLQGLHNFLQRENRYRRNDRH